MANLTAKQRNRLPKGRFGLPETRQYPMEDLKHARLAVQMASHAGPKDEKRIDAKAHRLYPSIRIGGK
jgi:hypothetical protein